MAEFHVGIEADEWIPIAYCRQRLVDISQRLEVVSNDSLNFCCVLRINYAVNSPFLQIMFEHPPFLDTVIFLILAKHIIIYVEVAFFVLEELLR